MTALVHRRQILTWPNLFTLARLVAIPVFVWLLFDRNNRGSAAWLLGALGSTDWVDGWLARRLGQTSDFGAKFDPIVDRVLFFVAIPSLIIDDSMPLLLAVAFVAREFFVALIAVLRHFRHLPNLVVSWEGKTGAFAMMFALPMFLGGESTLSYATFLAWAAWAFALPGLAYAWYSALFQYLRQTLNDMGMAPLPHS